MTPNRLMITERPSSAYRICSDCVIWPVRAFLNSSRVSTTAAGNAARPLRAPRCSPRGPAPDVQEGEIVVVVANEASKTVLEIDTSPNGEPPLSQVVPDVGEGTCRWGLDGQPRADLQQWSRRSGEEGVAAELGRDAAGNRSTTRCRRGFESTPVTRTSSRRPWPRRISGHCLDAGSLRHGLGRLVRQQLAVVAGGHGVVADEQLVDRARERGLEPLADNRDERDQSEPDHRRGRGGRSGRVPDRVLTSEAAGGRRGGHPVRRARTRAGARRATRSSRRPRTSAGRRRRASRSAP